MWTRGCAQQGSDVWHFFSSESTSRHPGTHQCPDQCLSQLSEQNCKPASQNSLKKRGRTHFWGVSANNEGGGGGYGGPHARPRRPTPLHAFLPITRGRSYASGYLLRGEGFFVVARRSAEDRGREEPTLNFGSLPTRETFAAFFGGRPINKSREAQGRRSSQAGGAACPESRVSLFTSGLFRPCVFHPFPFPAVSFASETSVRTLHVFGT